jgi:hypothetical protein
VLRHALVLFGRRPPTAAAFAAGKVLVRLDGEDLENLGSKVDVLFAVSHRYLALDGNKFENVGKITATAFSS